MQKKKISRSKDTPLMRQYRDFKTKHADTILLFRVGDFYEAFEKDAILMSKILGITLTKRSNGAASSVPMSGFPYHALETYMPKLVKAGNKVAIYDQLEVPQPGKGLVKRGLTEMVTPGVSLSESLLDEKKSNFLCCLSFKKELIGLALLDISTGQFLVSEGDLKKIKQLLGNFSPNEILINKDDKKRYQEKIEDNIYTTYVDEWVFASDYAREQLYKQFKTQSLKGFGVDHMQLGVVSAGVILHYLKETAHQSNSHINTLSRIDQDSYVWLDKYTLDNLELLQPQQEQGKSLLQIIDKTITPMGGRKLRNWICFPLKNVQDIYYRQQVVNTLVEDRTLREGLMKALKEIGDLERILSKVAHGRVQPREVIGLKQGLVQTHFIKELVSQYKDTKLKALTNQIADHKELLRFIQNTIADNPSNSLLQGLVIKPGFNANLDHLRNLVYAGKDELKKIQESEKKKTGISSLKIGYNKVFGYYLEVTHAHKNKVPSNWIRKQTLVNAERYITEELKAYEESILSAEEKLMELEQQLFNELIIKITSYTTSLQKNAQLLSTLDCLCAFAIQADLCNYSCPNIHEGKQLVIKQGRHPVIEQCLPTGTIYTPNDISLDPDELQLMIVTGPNMSGKSALLRQTALIVLLGQIGSFVPAAEASFGWVDKIFTRVGASDNISKGESTFMVEMVETASILNNISDRSLILMDEIGRGTSTYDGISIAWSIVEYIHNHPLYRAKTLFATHYHELNQLANQLTRVKNFHVAVRQSNGKVIFLHHLEPGGSEHSFGIHVAQLAGIPKEIVERAEVVMESFSSTREEKNKNIHIPVAEKKLQLTLFEGPSTNNEVMEKISQLDINTLSPIEALMKLVELKRLVKK